MPAILRPSRLFRVLALLAFLLPELSGFAQDRSETIRRRLLDPEDGSVLVAAHRGIWTDAPENSLEAIEAAVELGVDIVELDVRRTLDGTLILMHDPTLGRTTTGIGFVALTPYSAIRRLSLKKNGRIVEGSHVPTLEEALIAAKGRIMVNIDKGFSYFSQIVRIAERTGTLGQIIFKSSCNPEEAIKTMGEYRDKVIFMPVISLKGSGALARVYDYSLRLKAPVYELIYGNEALEYPLAVKYLLLGKGRIWYNTLWPSLCGGYDDAMSAGDPDSGYGFLIGRAGCGVIQTDSSAFLLDYLRSRGLR